MISNVYRRLFFLALLALLCLPAAYAQANPLSDGYNDTLQFATSQGLFAGSLTSAISKVILFLLSFAAILAVAAIIWGGFSYITSFGDEKKTEHAKGVILAAIIGLIILGVSFMAVITILNFFK